MHTAKKIFIPFIAAALISLSSCYKKDIQFGTDLGETFINLSSVDTIAVNMSTVVQDSFATNNPATLLIGSYKDAYLGTITGKPFFQLALPSDITVENNAVYDSLTFILKPNGSYYGDTSKSHTLSVNEIDQTLYYTYGSQIFNTSSFSIKPTPLGSRTLQFSPSKDSIRFRLSDSKGLELFNKLKTNAAETSTSTEFLNYFKGLSLSLGAADTSLVFGVNIVADSVKMRLHYHVTIPYPESKYKDFAISKNDLAFNQLISDRKGTKIQASGSTGISGLTEYTSAITGNQSYMQSGAGVLLKLTFPSLRSILQLGSTVKLINATLLVKVPGTTYDVYKYKLPANMFLATTDASNSVGSLINDQSGTGVLYSTPQIDYVYNTNATYAFNVTTSINTLLNTAGSAANGYYLLQNYPGNLSTMNRLVANDATHGTMSSQLILSVLTVKNN